MLHYDESCPDNNIEGIISAIQQAIDEVYQLKRLSKKEVRAVLNPWISEKIEKDQKALDKLFTKHILSGLKNSQEYTNYKKARNKLNRDISKAKDAYLRQKLEDNKFLGGK